MTNPILSTLVTISLAMIWAAGGVVLAQAEIMPIESTAALMLIGFLICAQGYGSILRGRARRAFETDIRNLRRSNETIAHEIAKVNKRMDEVAEAMERRSLERSAKVVSEVRVVESLIRDFADGIAERVRVLETNEPGARALQGKIEEAAQDGKIGQGYADTLAEPQLLHAIRQSLIENRVDLYLQPIVSLPQRKVRYYEAYTRLRTQDGTVIMPAQYIRVAEPAGLMSAVDNLLLFRCVQVIRRLSRAARDTAIFCNLSGPSLKDQTFFPQFLEFIRANRDLSGHIVFELAQETLRGAGAAENENMKALAELGFAFSLDKISSLDVDFAVLRDRHFRFIKVPVKLLLEKNANASGIAAADLKELLARHGLNLIGEKIEDENQVVNVLDFGVDYGQGYLFGEPRAIRDSGDTPPRNVVKIRQAAA